MLSPKKLQELYEKHDDEYCRFEKNENPTLKDSRAEGIYQLCKITEDLGKSIEMHASHDEISIWGNIETEEQFIYLMRCGVSWDESDCCFRVFT